MSSRYINFVQMQNLILSNYRLLFHDRSDEELLVVLCPGKNFALLKQHFNTSVVFLVDVSNGYYLYHANRQVDFLADFIASSGYKRVVFLGSSKAGFGSLLWAALLARKNCEDIKVGAVAFSPQSQLFPYNSSLEILPTYSSIYRRSESNSAFKRCLEFFGDVKNLLRDSSVQATVVYSNGYSMDQLEAEKLTALSNVELIPLDFSYHGAMLPYLIDPSDLNSVRKLGNKLLNQSTNDADLRRFVPTDIEDFVGMFSGLKVPRLNDVLMRKFKSLM